MELEEAIRSRRTHKQFDAKPLERAELEALLDLARWAPNHRLTNPWRFYVLGPESRARLEAGAERLQAGSSFKLRRAPTLVLVTTVTSGDQNQDDEDRLATGAAIYGLLLGAHARGLASFWNTPAVLTSPDGRAALGLADAEQPVGLVHLGRPHHTPVARERAPLEEVVSFLD